MKLVKISDLFEVKYGLNLVLNKLKQVDKIDENSINFVSRTEKNNGVSAIVKKIKGLDPIPEGTISVAGGGNSVLEAFLQPFPYYSGRDLYYLTFKKRLNRNKLLFYCYCIKMNRYKYNFDRQANKTLAELLVPSLNSIPVWVNNIKSKKIKNTSIIKNTYKFNTEKWISFKYYDIFTIEKGFYNKKPPQNINGKIPFVGASENNNGITSLHSLEDIGKFGGNGLISKMKNISDKLFEGNCITVANDGNSVASAFYQNKKFTCSHSINILKLKNYKLNKYIALFLCTLINKEKYRWNYGRKWRSIRMPKSTIKLPVNSKGKPDWLYMGNYIKSLPFSSSI